jgi:dTDP-glucose 4,6-dehydratase
MKRLPIEDLEHIFENTQDIWELFRGKSIFLTGGTGFFGKWLLESFIYVNEKLSLNAKITILTRNPESFLFEYPFYNKYVNTVNFVKGDILTYDFNLDEKFQYIIHAATEASDSLIKENPLLMMDTITIGTRKILNFAIKHNLNGFLYVSSGAVYGKQPEHIESINETDSYNININDPNSAYAEGKRIAELYCSTYSKKYKFPLKIVRCFAFVGPHLPLDTHFAIGNFIKSIISNENIIIKGDGTTIRSYMYASDLTTWLWKILFTGKENYPYNVGSNEKITILELANLIKSFNPKIKLIVQGDKALFQDKYIPNVKRAKQIGIEVKVDLYTAIEKTISYNKK